MLNTNINNQVAKIIEDIAQNGDKAVLKYVKKFDGIDLSETGYKISPEIIKNAKRNIHRKIKEAMRASFNNVSAYHKQEYKQIKKSWFMTKKGLKTGQFYTPVESVGIYVPGGRFSYPSTVIMTAVAAKCAGVKNLSICTPPKKINDAVLFACDMCGIKNIYAVGGAAAIAALAYGTQTIKKTDMIVGPGNIYVNEAKRQVFGKVGIDSLAGPSEVAIIADKDAPANFIISDIMAQAEHDPMAKAYLLCESAKKIDEIKKAIPEIALKQIIFQKCSIKEAIKKSNEIAPEHLELLVKNPSIFLRDIKNAGAVFAGYQTPTAAGDYWAGPSHVLPTGGTAKFSSGLSVMTFLKRSSYAQIIKKNKKDYEQIANFAESEGLLWHKKSAVERE
ncbi:MAG: histidinol dehydrogenase [Elusimicrobiota bacterium]|jgi:histidinol dehydrogenase|nr:histidinol dehydrogenase [Elusimicrobiota bacterium]